MEEEGCCPADDWLYHRRGSQPSKAISYNHSLPVCVGIKLLRSESFGMEKVALVKELPSPF